MSIASTSTSSSAISKAPNLGPPTSTTFAEAKARARSISPAKKAKTASSTASSSTTKAASKSSKDNSSSKDRKESKDSTSDKENKHVAIELSAALVLKPTTTTTSRKQSPTRSASPTRSSSPDKSLKPAKTATTKTVKKTTTKKDKDKPEMDAVDGPSTEAIATTNLETRLKKADVIANKYKKQLVVLQSKLEDVLSGQENHEETMTMNIDKIEKLMRDHQAAVKQSQDMQNKYETDKAALIRDKEGAIAREEELTNVVRHLKDTLAHRERRRSGEYDRGRSSRYDSHRGRDSSTYLRSSSVGPLSPSAARADSSQNFARLLRHKDRLIEQLQLELAEAQVKVMELENVGSERIAQLERMVIDTRMQNAKLLEDKEYYQTLFEEQMVVQEQMLERRSATSHSASTISASSSISQQLPRDTPASSIFEGSDISAAPEHVRKLEAEVSTLQEQNKALTQYVDNIVSKLMSHDSYEPLFAEGSITGDNPLRNAAMKENAPPPSLLKRAGSIFGGRARARPASLASHGSQDSKEPHISRSPQRQSVVSPICDTPVTAMTSRPSPNPNEDPMTATRVPIRRPMSMRVSSNEWQLPAPNPPFHRTSSGQPSPPTNGMDNRQSSYFSAVSFTASSNADATSTRAPSIAESSMQDDTSSFTTSTSTILHSAPSQSHATSNTSGGLHRSGTVIASGTNPRPLRLVQAKIEEDSAAERARRVANRQSWRGWFGKGNDPNAPGAMAPPPYEAQQGGEQAQQQGQGRDVIWPGQRELQNQMSAAQVLREKERGGNNGHLSP